jgi:hypothetical protein
VNISRRKFIFARRKQRSWPWVLVIVFILLGGAALFAFASDGFANTACVPLVVEEGAGR